MDDEAEAQAVILDLPEDGGHGIRLVLRISLLNAVLPVYQIIPGIIAEGVNRFDLLVIEVTGRPEDRIDELPPFLITSGWDVCSFPQERLPVIVIVDEEQPIEEPVVHIASAEQSRKDARLYAADNADERVRYEGDVIFALPVYGNRDPVVETKPLLEVPASVAILVEGGYPSLQFVNEHKDAASGLSKDLGDGFHRDILDAELLCLRLLPPGFGGSLAPFLEAVLILLDT